MKKRIIAFAISLVLIIGIGGCREKVTSESSNTMEQASVAPVSSEPIAAESETPSSPAPSVYVESNLENFYIAIESDELLNKYDTYYEYNSSEIQRIIIWTDKDIKDFAFIIIDADFTGDEYFLVAGDILFSLDELSPEKPFVADISSPEILPVNGISFLDENGVKRYFSINADGRGEEEAPPYFFREFENGKQHIN